MATLREKEEAKRNAWNRPGNPRWMQLIGNRVGQPGEATGGVVQNHMVQAAGGDSFAPTTGHTPARGTRYTMPERPAPADRTVVDPGPEFAPDRVTDKSGGTTTPAATTMRDVGTAAAPTTPPTRRQGAATPSRNAPTGLPGASNFDYEVESIRGLNRSVSQYTQGEGGRWDLARSVDYEKKPGMGERMVYDSTDPAYEPSLKYRQDQQHAITLKELENQGRLNEQALRNEGWGQRGATTSKKDAADKLAIEISKSLFDDEGTKPVDIDTAARQLLMLRELDEQEALSFMAGVREDHLRRIEALWKAWGILPEDSE